MSCLVLLRELPLIPAILPILPTLGGLWLALTGLGVCGLALLRPRAWLAVGRFVRSQWRGFGVLLGLALAGGVLWWSQTTEGPASSATALGPSRTIAGRRGALVHDGVFQNELLNRTAHWPCFSGGLSRRGAAGADGDPVDPVILWRGLAGCSVLSSAAFANGNLYVVGFQGDRSRLACLTAEGETLWSFTPEGMRTAIASPVLHAGVIYCGEGVHSTRQSRVFGVANPRGDHPPEVGWSWRTNGHVEGTPAIAGGRLFVPAGDDGLFAFALAEDGAAPQLIWRLPGDEYPDIETSLAADANHVYVGLGLSGQALVLLDAADGRELRRTTLPHPVFGPPAIASGRVFVGIGRGNLLTAASEGAGAVACLDANTLELLWIFETPAAVMGAVAVLDDQGEEGVAFASADGTVWRLDVDGHRPRSWRAGAPLLSSPAVSRTSLYVLPQSGQLTCLDRESLSPRWSVRVGAPGMHLSSPLLADGRVYVGTPDDGLVCVGDPSASTTGKATTPAATSRAAATPAEVVSAEPAP